MHENTFPVIKPFYNINFIQFVGLASKLQPLEKDTKLRKLYPVFAKLGEKGKTRNLHDYKFHVYILAHTVN